MACCCLAAPGSSLENRGHTLLFPFSAFPFVAIYYTKKNRFCQSILFYKSRNYKMKNICYLLQEPGAGDILVQTVNSCPAGRQRDCKSQRKKVE